RNAVRPRRNGWLGALDADFALDGVARIGGIRGTNDGIAQVLPGRRRHRYLARRKFGHVDDVGADVQHRFLRSTRTAYSSCSAIGLDCPSWPIYLHAHRAIRAARNRA